MKNLKTIFILFWGNLFAIAGAAAQSEPMRGNAKFNVVAVVLCIIFAGLAFVIIRLDKRVNRLEKQIKEDKP